MADSTFKFQLDHVNKICDMVVSGRWHQDNVGEFHAAYVKTVKSINASTYTLVIHSSELKVLHNEMVPKMEAAFKMYVSSGFKKVVLYCGDSKMRLLQLKRIADSLGYGHIFEFREGN